MQSRIGDVVEVNDDKFETAISPGFNGGYWRAFSDLARICSNSNNLSRSLECNIFLIPSTALVVLSITLVDVKLSQAVVVSDTPSSYR
jgi:hypothetical protein